MGRTRYSSLGIAASCRRMAVKVMKNPLIIHGTRASKDRICASTGTTIIKLLTKFKKELSLNGNCVFSLVSHSRGSPHYRRLSAFIGGQFGFVRPDPRISNQFAADERG